MDDMARTIREALESADLSAYGDLLDPDVHWGAPDARRPSCRNRDQVLAWYQRGQESGTRARVSEVTVMGSRLLVGLTVIRYDEGRGCDVEAARWQVLTVRNGRIVDIVGFDDRNEAVTRAAAPVP
jgi:ketosteroid isomerase-like protein